MSCVSAGGCFLPRPRSQVQRLSLISLSPSPSPSSTILISWRFAHTVSSRHALYLTVGNLFYLTFHENTCKASSYWVIYINVHLLLSPKTNTYCLQRWRVFKIFKDFSGCQCWHILSLPLPQTLILLVFFFQCDWTADKGRASLWDRVTLFVWTPSHTAFASGYEVLFYS